MWSDRLDVFVVIPANEWRLTTNHLHAVCEYVNSVTKYWLSFNYSHVKTSQQILNSSLAHSLFTVLYMYLQWWYYRLSICGHTIINWWPTVLATKQHWLCILVTKRPQLDGSYYCLGKHLWDNGWCGVLGRSGTATLIQELLFINFITEKICTLQYWLCPLCLLIKTAR